jgi:hypothetical protein
MNDTCVYVYIIAPKETETPVKVGISSDPWKRLSSVQTGSPVELDVVEIYGCDTRDEAVRLERDFHAAHAPTRLSGEWFNLEADEANYWLFCETVPEKYFQ